MRKLKKLLDEGWYIQLFQNELGGYTATANRLLKAAQGEATDDFKVATVIDRIYDKIHKAGEYAN